MNYLPKLGDVLVNRDNGNGTVVGMKLVKEGVSIEIKHDKIDPLTKEHIYSYEIAPYSQETVSEIRPDNQQFKEIIEILSAIQYDKEGTYGSSWKGKGEYRGIMANIDRKYDRLDKMTNDEVSGKIPNLVDIEESLRNNKVLPEGANVESKVDAIADLANYCVLYMTYIKTEYPEVFKLWLKHNLPQ